MITDTDKTKLLEQQQINEGNKQISSCLTKIV